MQPPDCLPVKLWRDFAHLNLSASWKRDVETTITDIELWKQILSGWHYFDKKGKKHRKSPAIKPLLDEYERRQFDAIQPKGNGIHSTESLPQRPERLVSQHGMPPLLEKSQRRYR